MTALDYILDGLEAELALERELGVRFIECDRALLKGEGGAVKVGEGQRQETRDKVVEPLDARRDVAPKGDATIPSREPGMPAKPKGDATFLSREQNGDLHPFVFLHHRVMGAQETEMMAKTVAALGTTLESTPVVFEKPIPKAKAYVVLGQRALAKFFPGRKTAFDSWFESEKGKPILFTRAPSDILRFKEVTPAVKKIKFDMWTSLKSVLRRIRG